MAFFSKKTSQDVPRRRQGNGAVTDRRAEAAQRQRTEEASSTTFRRNRTLSGSASSRVAGADVSQTDLKSARTHAHELVAHRRRLSGILSVVLLVGVGCFTFLYQLTASVTVSSVDHVVQLEQSRYQRAIEDYLHRYPIERLRFAADDVRLTQFVQAVHPEVRFVQTVGVDSIGVTKYQIVVRQPVASWQIGDKQYYVDAEGVSYEQNYYDAPAVRIVDESGAKNADGTAIASKRFLTFVGYAVSLAESSQLHVEQAVIPYGTTRQVELRVKGKPYGVKLSLDRPVGEQIEDMRRAVAYLESKSVTPKYIDVRVSGKAFYR